MEIGAGSTQPRFGICGFGEDRLVKTLARHFLALITSVFLVLNALPLRADIHDPYDPFDRSRNDSNEPDNDADKSADQLILEGSVLLQDERPLDARTKLLKALQKDPKQYRAHILLAGYYMVHVGHFKLALKYVKQALALFEERNGKPPYTDLIAQSEHEQLLYLLSQARLNLDDYQGALDVLDEFTAHKYTSEWYAGTRSWVLMKLGRLDEAIKVARLGVVSGAEPGRSLNMLGILLSMKSEREASIQVFRDAIAYEMSLGKDGQPATPFNNMGEVYKETFDEVRAESAWLRATSMPDGCEHVLPALNLSLLYIDELNFSGAKRAIDNFESCIAQFPLRNGEEHKALVNFARGRIALHTGHVDEAIKHFEQALEYQQWFGKIGTSQQDLEAAALISLATALEVKNNQMKYYRFPGTAEWARSLKDSALNSIRAWWLMRRARQILTDDLDNFEDIYVRNTDSLIEYGTLGSAVAGMPTAALRKRIAQEEAVDDRKDARYFYMAYLGENYLKNGRRAEGQKLLNEVINMSRPTYDNLLRLHALLLSLGELSPHSDDYAALANQAFALSRASLRNYGFALPVNFAPEDEQIVAELRKGAFILDNSRDLQYSINYKRNGEEIELHFYSTNSGMVDIKVRGSDLPEAVNKLSDEVFTVDLK
ncbi:MAG: tetratricopeptide repeat protein [Deltaproteobacteria bacterium]|nr:tetratricopeptide repeat protein [Deltaproteobacteria bacterium]